MSKSDEGVQISNRGGWQSKPFFQPEKEFELLWADIEEKINMYHQTIELKNGVRISDMWFNVNYKGSANRQHQHSGSIHSGVYYIRTPENCGNLCFEHPSPLHNTEWDHVPNVMGYIPQANNLYLFPNWLSHYVLPNLNEKEERISISFNLKLDKSPEL